MDDTLLWSYLPHEIALTIFTFLDAQDLFRTATVNKQWCVNCYDNGVWKSLFYRDYDYAKNETSSTAEVLFRDRLKPTHPEHSILTDWRHGYIMRIVGKTPQERFNCLSDCLKLIKDGMMFVDGHEINSYCHRAQLFEPILPLNIEKDFYIARPGHDTPDKTMPISDLHNPKGLEMYNTIMESSKSIPRLWILVAGGKHPEIVPRIQESKALSICLLSKWYTQVNANGYPFLVKFDSDLELTQWLFHHCYERSAITVISVNESLMAYAAKQWYLQGFDPMVAMMVYLKRHISYFFGIREKCFCWAHDASTIYSFNISYEKKFTDRFFYTVIEKGNTEVKRIPVIEYFLVFGNGFAPGELTKDFYYIRRDKPLKHCRNGKAPTLPLTKNNSSALNDHLLWRGAFVAGGKAWKTALNTMTMKEQNKLFRKIYKASRKYGVDFEDLKIFFKLARRHGSFWRIDACRQILVEKPRKEQLLVKITEVMDGRNKK
jgi:hypothetical protein